MEVFAVAHFLRHAHSTPFGRILVFKGTKVSECCNAVIRLAVVYKCGGIIRRLLNFVLHLFVWVSQNHFFPLESFGLILLERLVRQ